MIALSAGFILGGCAGFVAGGWFVTRLVRASNREHRLDTVLAQCDAAEWKKLYEREHAQANGYKAARDRVARDFKSHMWDCALAAMLKNEAGE